MHAGQHLIPLAQPALALIELAPLFLQGPLARLRRGDPLLALLALLFDPAHVVRNGLQRLVQIGQLALQYARLVLQHLAG